MGTGGAARKGRVAAQLSDPRAAPKCGLSPCNTHAARESFSTLHCNVGLIAGIATDLGVVLAAADWKPKKFGQEKEEPSRAVHSPSRERALVFGFWLWFTFHPLTAELLKSELHFAASGYGEHDGCLIRGLCIATYGGYGAGFKGVRRQNCGGKSAAKERESRLNSPFVTLPAFARSRLAALHSVC